MFFSYTGGEKICAIGDLPDRSFSPPSFPNEMLMYFDLPDYGVLV